MFFQSSPAALHAAEGEPDRSPVASGKLKIVVLQGTPYERGFVHGKTLKDDINSLVVLWKEHLTDSYQIPADEFIKKFVSHSQYLAAMKRWTPDLVEEVKGLAAGAGIDFDTMLVFQWIDEYWAQGKEVAADRCSGIGVGRRAAPRGDRQNLDMTGFYEGYQVILHVKHHDSDLETFVCTIAGVIATNGMNNHAIGICCNTLLQLDSCRDGLPVACIVRGVLAQKTEDAAIKFLHDVKHASGQNYIIGGPERAFSFECSSHKVSGLFRKRPATWSGTPTIRWPTRITLPGIVNISRAKRTGTRDQPIVKFAWSVSGGEHRASFRS